MSAPTEPVSTSRPQYQAVIQTPVGKVGLMADDEVLTHVSFLFDAMPLREPQGALLRETAAQIAAYFTDAAFRFDLPMRLEGSAHQQAVWAQIASIASGEVCTYADIAQRVGSVPRAVGGACGQNPVPIVIPCHRVVAANGVGGFNARRDGVDWVPIKRWLLAHERRDLFSADLFSEH